MSRGNKHESPLKAARELRSKHNLHSKIFPKVSRVRMTIWGPVFSILSYYRERVNNLPKQ